MARLESTQEALKQAEGEPRQLRNHPLRDCLELPVPLPTQPSSQPESVGTDSVDELSAAYGDKSAEGRDADALKQAPER